MIAWGTVMTRMGLVQDYHGLLIARVFLGVAEAGLYPGVAYYLTMWYCTEELAFRQGLFFSAASMAGAFSGLLAYAIAQMDGVAGYAGWRWIFILEGLLTVVVAVAAFFLLHDFPDTASFLTTEEKAWVVHRLKYQGSKKSGRVVAESDHFQWKYVRLALTDWQLYLSFFMYWGIVCPLYGISLFLPSIIKELGYVSTTAQLLTIPIYCTAAVLAVVVCWLSDRAAKSGASRWPYVFVPMCVILVGFVMAITGSAKGGVPGVVYAGVFIATCGIYPAFPGNITWISNNLAGSYKRAAGMAFQIGIGNLGGAMASNFYRSADAPKYGGLFGAQSLLWRRQCEEAARHYGVPALRDLDEAALEAGRAGLDPLIFRRARHVVTENARTLAAADALAAGELRRLGELMAASHASMRDDFEITLPAIDRLVEIAADAIGPEGGARMTGGGFGGCIVALAPDGTVERAREAVAR
ncbi:MAG: hypothetical protein M1823_006425, partial [Watsoniomyces obsoletus]